MSHDRQVPNAEESDCERDQGNGYGKGSFLSARAFEQLERNKPGSEKTKEDAWNEDVKDEEVGRYQGNHEGPPLALLNGFRGLGPSGDADAAAVGYAQYETFAAGKGSFNFRLACTDDALQVAAKVFFRGASS